MADHIKAKRNTKNIVKMVALYVVSIIVMFLGYIFAYTGVFVMFGDVFSNLISAAIGAAILFAGARLFIKAWRM